MAGRTNDRIYLVTQGSSKWSGRILLFDVVNSYRTNITSTVTSHAIEKENNSVSDHVFNRNAIVTLQAYVSDAWKSDIKEETVNQFNSFSEQRASELYLLALTKDNTVGSSVKNYKLFSEAVRTILSRGTGPAVGDYTDTELQQIIGKSYVEHGRGYALAEALKNKNLLTSGVNNKDSFDNAINTVAQARELLREIKKNRLLCTLVGKYETFENMTLTVFDNPLKSGEGSQALYLNLTFEQQRIGTTRTDSVLVNVDASELVDSKNKSKMSTADREEAFRKQFKGYLELMLSDTNSFSKDKQLASKFSTETSKTTWIDTVSTESANIAITEGYPAGQDYLLDQVKIKKREI